ncbi:MAG TPA: FUSC family protein [Myxococcales bacterium]|nr:FUSC family protein [Myxococcales bacterium]
MRPSFSAVGEQVAGHVRGSLALETAQPQWISGLRTATAMMVPLAFGWATNRPQMLWVGLGGWLGMLADPGGPYHVRALAMAEFAAIGGLATALGGVLAAPPWIAAPALFACALACSLMRVRGDTAATIGALALTMFCITQGYPSPHGASVVRGLLLSGGSLFALVISVAVWPFRPYRPVRRALAAVWIDLSRLLAAVRVAAEAPGAQVWDDLAARRRKCREDLEQARHALAIARFGLQGETARGLQLLVLYEIAELSLGDVAAVSEALRAAAEEGKQVPEGVLALLDRVSAAQLAIADSVEGERSAPQLDLRAGGGGEIGVLLERVVAATVQAAEAATALERGGEARQKPGAPPPRDQWPSLRDVLAPGSVELRHALRVAIVTTAASLLAAAVHLQRSYWVTVTVIIVLQPHAVSTVRKALQRVGGTVVGGIFAALIARVVHRPVVLAPILFVLSWLAVAVRRMNYAAFAALLTPVFVLLAESGGPHLTRTRIVDTLVGGGLALLGALTLWPTRELERMPSLISAVLAADRDYLAAVLRGAGQDAVVAARRRVGLAAANAEAALQRLLGEGPPPKRVEPVMALVAYARRMSASITWLGALRPSAEDGALLEEMLSLLAEAAGSPGLPPPLPAVDESRLPEPGRRLARQARGAHSALARLAGQG